MKTFFEKSLWIWNDECNGINEYVDFYCEFTLADTEQDVLINISADSQYGIFVNDTFAGTGQYSDYESYKVFDTVNINDFVVKGVNKLKIIVYYQGEDSSTYRRQNAGLIFEVIKGESIICFSDKTTLNAKNAYYISGNIDRLSPQLSFSFKYDGTIHSTLIPTKSIEINKEVKLFPRKIKMCNILPPAKTVITSQGVFQNLDSSELGRNIQYDYLSFREFNSMTNLEPPVTLPYENGLVFKCDDGDGIYLIIDLKSEETGLFTIDIDLPKSARIEIGYGEHLDDLRVRGFIGGRHFAAQYEGRKGRQLFTHYFKRFGLRYLQIHIHSHDFTLYYAGILPQHYPVSDKPYFICSDHLHNKIYDTCLKTLLLCMHEHYEDCPWREQALYTMDSRNQMLCGYYAFGEYDMPRESIRLMALSQREDNMLELCSPARVCITIPSFTIVFVVQLYEYLLYSGDRDFTAEMLPYAKRIVDSFVGKIEENGLIPCFTDTPYWNFYEWQDGLWGETITRNYKIKKTYDAPLNAFLSLALSAISKIYKILGGTEQFYYDDLKGKINSNIEKLFWNNDKEAYCSFIGDGVQSHYAELTQALIICCDACPSEKLELLLDKIKSETLIPVTLSYSIFKYEAFMKLPSKFSKFVFNDIAKVWGDMLFAGTTTFWETQKGAWDFSNGGSLCHGWSAVPVYFYFAYAMGLKPSEVEAQSLKYDIKTVESGLYNIRGKLIMPDSTEIKVGY